MMAGKTLQLIRYSRRAHLGALMEDVLPRIPSRIPMEGIAPALKKSSAAPDLALFALSGFLQTPGSELNETKQLGALGAGSSKRMSRAETSAGTSSQK
eukprot:Skav233458  [mRNA]  locus=scaffold1080:69239:69532:- [translate_table: standard]